MSPFWLTFVVWQFSYDPGWFVGVQVNVQDVTETLWVQVTPCSDHMCRRQATLSPGNMGHDVHWNWTKKKTEVKILKTGWWKEWFTPLRGTFSLTLTWLWGDKHYCVGTELCYSWNDPSVHVHIILDHARVRLLAAPWVRGHHDDLGARRGWQIWKRSVISVW